MEYKSIKYFELINNKLYLLPNIIINHINKIIKYEYITRPLGKVFNLYRNVW
jgi:hypothetical protein